MPGDDFKSALHTPDSQAIDQAVGEALGYWQIGDIDSLHKYYADDVVVVSGAWEPPVIGWDNYLKSYQAQRAQVTGARMERSNTSDQGEWHFGLGYLSIRVCGADGGKVAQFRGHTTLVLHNRRTAG